MPGARAHDAVTVVTTAAAVASYWALAPRPEPVYAGVFAASYLFAGFACAGDLDVNSREYHRWGALRFLWWPYRTIVRHRSRASHGLLLGGVLRIVYLAGLLALLLTALALLAGRLAGADAERRVSAAEWSALRAVLEAHRVEVWIALAGFVLGGAVHALTDLAGSGLKRRLW